MSDYIHGYSEEEQARLTRMQTILNDEQIRAMDLAGVRSILDVGAGLGQLSRALARAAEPGVRVVGIERDDRQRTEAQRQAERDGEAELLDLRAGDAERLPLSDAERGTFDLAHARFLLEHVRDPAAVVREMVSAVRPGGRIVLVDDDHALLTFWPDCTEGLRVWTRYWESFRELGYDPLIGRKLAGLLREAGAVQVRVTTVFYGAVRGQPLFDPVVDNLIEVMRSAQDRLDESGWLPRTEIERGLAAIDAWRNVENATLWYSLPLAEGCRVD